MMISKALALVFAFAVLDLSPAVSAQSTTVDSTQIKTTAGLVRGDEKDGVVAFKGVPYAQPPVGKLRWRAPLPVQPWTSVRDATAFGPACMQADDVPKSEDCLTLNVWRPSASAKKPMPVMVWIYGGALVHGRTAMYPGEALARQGVVVVSMNYRMGRFGFFAHPELAKEDPQGVRGNFGYLDQLAALQWVKSNIRAFGGDPSNVTIFGESAGGGSVMAHMVSPMSRGLFRQAILQSPGLPTARASVLPMTELKDAESIARDYARSVGIIDDGAKGLAALRAMSAEKIVQGTSAHEELEAMAKGAHVSGVSGAIRDGKFLKETPEAAFAAGRQAKVPMIVGANNRDLGLGVANAEQELFALFGANADKARKAYNPKGDLPLDELKQQVLADKTLVEPARHLANEAARAGQPTWHYRFSYVPESQREKLKGTIHGFEIPYTLDAPSAMVGLEKTTSADREMAKSASGYWVDFAKTGNPNGSGRPAWPKHDPGADLVLNFTNSGVVVEPDALKPRLDLWQARMDVIGPKPRAVTVGSFIRAETDRYFADTAGNGAFGALKHRREMAKIEAQDVVRMNRDTLYSSGVFDLQSAPLTITLPDPGNRFMSMQVISEDHYTTEVVYSPGRYTYTPDRVGTRYVYIIIRTLADPESPDDVKAANNLQDQIKVEQANAGTLQLPNWDKASRDNVRGALNKLAELRGGDSGAMFGRKDEVDPVAHLIGTAIGWGGNPASAAIYRGIYPKRNDGKQSYEIKVKDVPVDGFWSISVYNEKGYFEKNPLNAYSVNSLTAKADPDGSVRIRFGDCGAATPNCLPITKGWNYTVRMYRPRAEVLDGRWTFPEAQPMK